MCEMMKWSHLPVAGGLYDQHPSLLEQWRYIFQVRARYEEEERKKKTRSGSSNGVAPRTPPRSSRRR